MSKYGSEESSDIDRHCSWNDLSHSILPFFLIIHKSEGLRVQIKSVYDNKSYPCCLNKSRIDNIFNSSEIFKTGWSTFVKEKKTNGESLWEFRTDRVDSCQYFPLILSSFPRLCSILPSEPVNWKVKRFSFVRVMFRAIDVEQRSS